MPLDMRLGSISCYAEPIVNCTGTVHTSSQGHLTSDAIAVAPSGEPVRDDESGDNPRIQTVIWIATKI